MNEKDFIRFLKVLKETKLVKITGSYADGTNNENSDLDFFVKLDNPDYQFRGEKRNIQKIKDILDIFH